MEDEFEFFDPSGTLEVNTQSAAVNQVVPGASPVQTRTLPPGPYVQVTATLSAPATLGASSTITVPRSSRGRRRSCRTGSRFLFSPRRGHPSISPCGATGSRTSVSRKTLWLSHRSSTGDRLRPP